RSRPASNIVADDTKSTIAPALPAPPIGDEASLAEYLSAARHALATGRTGEAQESLEMAETRALARVVTPDAADMPDPDARVVLIHNALQALGEGDPG